MYVITLCDTDSVTGEPLFDGQLQFFHCAFLQQSFVKKSCPMIIGLARGRESAIDLVCQIVQECMERQHNADLVPFLARRDSRIALPGGGCESGVRMAAVDQTDVDGNHTVAVGRREEL